MQPQPKRTNWLLIGGGIAIAGVLMVCGLCLLLALFFPSSSRTPTPVAEIQSDPTSPVAVAPTQRALVPTDQPKITPSSPTIQPTPTRQAPSPQPSATRQPTAAPPPPANPKLGDVLQAKGYSLVALSVADPAKPGIIYRAEPGKKLIAVEVIVGNISGKVFSSNPLNATLVDNLGFAYTPDLGGFDGEMDLIDVNPGEKVRGWISFKIPPQSKAQTIKYEFSGYPSIVLQMGLTR